MSQAFAIPSICIFLNKVELNTSNIFSVYIIHYTIITLFWIAVSIAKTKNAPGAIGPYSQAIEVNGMLFISGQIPINPATGNIEATDIEGQAKQSIENIGAILAEAGTTFEKVVKTTCFLSDMADFAAFNAVYAEYFTSKPARSCVAVKTLPKNVLCEVEVIAEI